MKSARYEKNSVINMIRSFFSASLIALSSGMAGSAHADSAKCTAGSARTYPGGECTSYINNLPSPYVKTMVGIAEDSSGYRVLIVKDSGVVRFYRLAFALDLADSAVPVEEVTNIASVICPNSEDITYVGQHVANGTTLVTFGVSSKNCARYIDVESGGSSATTNQPTKSSIGSESVDSLKNNETSAFSAK